MAAGDELRIALRVEAAMEGTADIAAGTKELQAMQQAQTMASRATLGHAEAISQLSSRENQNLLVKRMWDKQFSEIHKLTQANAKLVGAVLSDRNKILELDEDQLKIFTKLEPLLESIVNNNEVMNELEAKRPALYQKIIDQHQALAESLDTYHQVAERGGKVHGPLINQEVFYKKLTDLYQFMKNSSENTQTAVEGLGDSLKALDPLIQGLKRGFSEWLHEKGFNLVGKLRRTIAEGLDFNRLRGAISGVGKETTTSFGGLSNVLDKIPVQFLRNSKAIGSMGGEATKAAAATSRMGTVATASTGMLGSMGGVLARVGPLLGKVAAAAGPIALVLLAVLPAIILVTAALGALVTGLKMNIEVMEKYRQTANRGLGSIRELTDRHFQLVGALGATSAEANAAMDALVKAGISMKDITRLAGGAVQGTKAYDQAFTEVIGTIHKFSQASGVSEGTIANLTKKFIELGYTRGPIKDFYDTAIAMQRQYMLSSEELSAALDIVRKRSEEMELIFGEGATKQFGEINLAITGLLKQAGLTQEASQQFGGMIGQLNEQTIFLLTRGGVNINDAMKDMNLFAKGLAQGLANTREQIDKLGPTQARFLNDAYKSMGLNEELLRSGQVVMDAIGRSGEQNMQSIISQNKQTGKSLEENFREAEATLKQMLNAIAGPVLEIFNTIAGPVADALVAAFQGINDSGILQEVAAAIKEYQPVIKETVTVIANFAVEATKWFFWIASGAFKLFRAIGGFTTAFLAVISPPLAAIYAVVKAILSLFDDADKKTEKLAKKYASGNKTTESSRRVSFSRGTPVSPEEAAENRATRAHMHDTLVKAGVPEEQLYSMTTDQMEKLMGDFGPKGFTPMGDPRPAIPEALPRREPVAAHRASPAPTVQFTDDQAIPPPHFSEMLEVLRAMDKKQAALLEINGEQFHLFQNSKFEERGKQEKLPSLRRPGSTGNAHGSSISSWNPFNEI
jgi:hypothetical protein